MNSKKLNSEQIRKLTLAAMLTAIVVVLQLLGSAIHFGIFSINLALVPIVIGAALLGVPYGAWLGFVNAVVILLSGDAAPFLAISAAGTIVTVIAKGTLAGLCSGLVYRLIAKSNKYAAVILAAIVCPIVNTGVFLIGCRLFFWETIEAWGKAAGYDNVTAYAFLGLAGVNFLTELVINAILAPAVALILGVPRDKNTSLIVYGAILTVLGFAFLIFAIVLINTKARDLYLFTDYRVKAGLNLKQRYYFMALFSDLSRLGGIFLLVYGLTRRKAEKKNLQAEQKRK